MQAGGHRFDPVHLHHLPGGRAVVCCPFTARGVIRKPFHWDALRFALQGDRLLFNNLQKSIDVRDERMSIVIVSTKISTKFFKN